MKRTLLLFFVSIASTSIAQQWTEQTQQLPDLTGTYTPTPGVEFGWDVDADGDYSIVGSLGESAVINFFDGTDWLEQAVLSPADLGFNDGYGGSVSISGNTCVVGAFLQNNFEGAVYVYTRTGTTWSLEQKLEASDGVGNDRFGQDVSIDGENIVVGNQNSKAYIFSRMGTTWTEDATISPVGIDPTNSFGFTVGIFGNTVAVGDWRDLGNKGAVYVYTGGGSTWNLQEKLTASDADFGDQFGWDISLWENQLLVGANRDADNGSGAGAAYLFSRSGITWNVGAKYLASDGQASDNYGGVVTLSETKAVISANGFNSFSGAAYTYENNGSVLDETQKLEPSDGATGDGFGTSSAVAGNQVLVGSSYHTQTGSVTDGGGVYIYWPCTDSETLDATVTKSATGVYNAASNAGASYQWINCETQEDIAGETSQVFTPTVNGDYAVRITLNGCLKVSACIKIINVGVFENTFVELKTYPEPARDFIVVELPTEVNNATINVFSIQGQLVKQLVVSDKSQIDVHALENGSYFLTIKDIDSDKIFRSRFTKIK